MKTLIVYATTYGCAEDCAKLIAQALPGGADLHNLKQGPVDAAGYDTVVVGGSVYAGSIQKRVTAFCAANRDALLAKRLGLFVSCSSPDGEQYLDLFGPGLRDHAAAKAVLGGEFRFDRMSLPHKLIIKMLQKSKGGALSPAVDREAARRFAAALVE